jgi:hypothetical protein
LLSSGEECAHGAHNLRANQDRVYIPEQLNWNTVAEFRIKSHQPGCAAELLLCLPSLTSFLDIAVHNQRIALPGTDRSVGLQAVAPCF